MTEPPSGYNFSAFFIHSFFYRLFKPAVGWKIKPFPNELVREMLLLNFGIRIIVGVFVTFSITDFFHELRGRIPDTHWNWKRSRPLP